MKLSLSSIFSPNSHSADEKKIKKKKSKDRSMSRSETPSFGSNISSLSAGSSDKSTPKTVLPPLLSRNMSCLDPEYWSAAVSASASSSADLSSPKAVVPQSVSELFGVFDRDGDGKITKQDLELVLHRLGSDPPTEEEVFFMLAEADRDGDGCISLEEFGAIGSALGLPGSGTAQDSDLRDAFGIFDADSDGKISAEELLGVFLTLGDTACTLEDCRRMIGGVDSNGDGFVCFEDFARMMHGQGW